MDDLDTHLRTIIREEIARANGSIRHAEPELVSIDELCNDPLYDMTQSVVRDLVAGSPDNGFPSVRLGTRTIKIDKRRLNAWIASGGLGVKA